MEIQHSGYKINLKREAILQYWPHKNQHTNDIIIIEIGLGTSGTAVTERSYLLNALSAKVQRLQNVNAGTLSQDIA